MSGCSLRVYCRRRSASSSASLCQPFSLLASVCLRDPEMANMKGCQGYNKVCRERKDVVQCSRESSFSKFPTTRRVMDEIKSICNEMSMDGCEKCVFKDPKMTFAQCDGLSTYFNLCYQMPEMNQCGPYHALCKEAPDLEICKGRFLDAFPTAAQPSPPLPPSSSTPNSPPSSQPKTDNKDASSSEQQDELPDLSLPPPIMKMYFFTDMPFYLLFGFWIPRTAIDLVLACLAMFLLGFFYEGVQVYRSILEARWLEDYVKDAKSSGACHNKETSLTKHFSPSAFKRHWKTDLQRALYHFFTVSIAYIVMLAVMSYHVAIFVAAIGGMAVGTFVLGRYRVMNGLSVLEEVRDVCC